MHIYLMTRGIKQDVDRFIQELSSQYLPFAMKEGMKDLQGKPIPAGTYPLQISVRPIQLWEIVFPREHKDLMLNTFFDDGEGGKTQHAKHQKFVWAIRKALGSEVQPIGKHDLTKPKLAIYRANTEMIGIGIKDDKDFEWGEGI